MSLRDELEALLKNLAAQQAIPNDSWRAEWNRLRERVPENQVVPRFEKSPSGKYEVAIYDGFDEVWTTVQGGLSETDAVKLWNDRTSCGTKLTSYSDIDYYVIRPEKQ